MALTTAQDQQTLSSWNLSTDYQNHRKELIEVARIVYRTISSILNGQPQPIDCEDALTDALLGTTIFAGILARKRHAAPSLHLPFARAMARHLLDTDWSDIIKP